MLPLTHSPKTKLMALFLFPSHQYIPLLQSFCHCIIIFMCLFPYQTMNSPKAKIVYLQYILRAQYLLLNFVVFYPKQDKCFRAKLLETWKRRANRCILVNIFINNLFSQLIFKVMQKCIGFTKINTNSNCTNNCSFFPPTFFPFPTSPRKHCNWQPYNLHQRICFAHNR